MKWTKDEDNVLLDMMNNGYRYKDISLKIERTERAIRERSRKLGCIWSEKNEIDELEKVCLECGKKYKGPKNNKQHIDSKFCSKSCSVSNTNKKRKKKNFCKNCGKEIDIRNTYCGHICHNEYKYKEFIDRWKKGEESGISGKDGTSRYIRKYIFDKYNNSCSKCGWNKINEKTGKSPLNLEHKDGDWKNNKEENLDLLCPNCHSLTETYGSLNIGNGRKLRRKSTS